MPSPLSQLRSVFLLFALAAGSFLAQAQTNCATNVSMAQGYTTSINSVVQNANGTYTIVLRVTNNGCIGCKKLNSLTIKAAPGTYSNVSVQQLSGAFTYASISMGPTLSQCAYTGFRINNTNGIGNGQAAAFSVTYTLTSLQNQIVDLKTSSSTLSTTFTIAQFQAVLSCLNPPPPSGIVPYFTPFANKTTDIIGVELRSLYNVYLANGSIISNDIFQILGTSVRITIRTQPTQHAAAVSLLSGATYGLVQELNDPANNLINGTLPIMNLLSLNGLPNLLVSARPIYAPLRNAGLITSQGDSALRSFRARDVFRVDGSGVKVGVLSDSYNTITGNPAADDVLRKDLPGTTNPDHPTPVQVLQDFPFGTRTDEGRAMLQIVHDVAPGADLAFRTGFLGPVDMAKGIRELEQAGCDVIVDDISYISEPFFRDGVIAQAVDAVKALGVSYFSAAGNFGTNSWQGTYTAATAPAGITGTAHNFASGTGGTDVLQNVTLYQGDYTVVLQWDDGTVGTTTNTDIDIYLAGNTGNVLFGFNRVNIGGDPIEILPFTVTADSVQANILITRASGTASTALKYVVYRGKLRINEYSGLTASTITGQANAAGAIAVGAVLYTNTPQYGAAPTVASFSSRGGTPVNGANRFKPDITAPNGVNTSVNLGGVNIDGDDFPNFFGTSAAAPHAAGVAALLLEARTKFYGNTLSPDGVKGLLQSTALDMGAPGYDVASGSGYIRADAALQGLANPSPFITGITYDTTLTPGVDTLQLTIFGEYLSNASTVWLDGAPLTSGVVVQGDSAIITLVQPFDALYPEIQVYNPPLVGTNGTDGGLSNPLYFTTKETILVRVDDKSKKYGEALPAFTANYSVESVGGSVTLAAEGLTQAEIDRIQGIGLTTIANAQSNVGLWGIGADPNDPLNPDSGVPATSPLDISLLQRYNVRFDDGLLTIDPAELLITPRDTTFTYNDSIAGISSDYVFSSGTSIPLNITPADASSILNAVRVSRGTALVNRAGLVRGTALVNGQGVSLLDAALLNNVSFMVSQRITATRGTALVNGELIDPAELFSAAAFTNANARSVRGTALVNAFRLVRGTALVNTLDSLGNVTNTSPLVNSSSLVNSSGLLNSSTITLNSNTQTLVIMGDEDIAILSGEATGEVTLRSVNLVTGNTVGTHLIIPGTFITNNFNVTYGVGHVTILPAPVQFTIDPATLTQTYTGTDLSVGVTAVPADVAFTVTYNGSTTPPVNAGTYTVEVTSNDPNYTGSASGTLVVQKATAQLTLTPATLDQTYTGTPRTVGVTVVPAAVNFEVTYNGSTTAPVNAGTYAVQVTVNDLNYVGSTSGTLVVQKATAQLTLTPATLNQTYTGAPRTVGVTVVPAGVSFAVTYNGSSTAPVNAGTYAVQVTSNDPNYVGAVSGTLVVQKATAQITFPPSTLNQTYSATARTVVPTVVPAGINFTVTYNGSSTAPVNAGTYPVVVTVNDPNHVGTASATLVVQKAPATARTAQPIYVINKGASLPTFTAAYSGLLNGQTASVVSSVSFTVSPAYCGLAGVYQIIVNATAANYTFTSVNGTLYVNPAGSGTKQVKPTFICYQVQNPPVNGYTHVAWFTYENQNATPVYIPVGTKNQFSGSARDASLQPTVFQPGISQPIAIPYMGGSLTWKITSNKSSGSPGSILATTANVVCSAPGAKRLEIGEEEVEQPVDLRVYPNPSAGRVFLEFTEGDGEGAMIEVHNATGARCAVTIEPVSDNLRVIDLSDHGRGMYIISIVRASGIETRRVIIE